MRKTERWVKAEPCLRLIGCVWKPWTLFPAANWPKAVTYIQNQKPYLSAFLDHSEVDISNNFAENTIRPFT